jgi:hypothetical protein
VLEQIAYVAQILAAFGVVFSLVYVGRQLKLTNATSRLMVRQSMSGQMTDFTMSIASSSELAATVAKMLYGDLTRDDATGVERIRLVCCYGAILERLNLAYEQQKDGILSREELEALYPPGNPWMTTSFLASMWPTLKTNWTPDFAEWLERRNQAFHAPKHTD